MILNREGSSQSSWWKAARRLECYDWTRREHSNHHMKRHSTPEDDNNNERDEETAT